LGVVQNGPQIAADRYTYHSATALSLLFGGALLAWPRRAVALRYASMVILVLLAALTWQQTGVWKNSSTFWARVLSVDGNSAIGRNGRGAELAEQGNAVEAMEEYRRSIALNPRYVDPHNNLGYELAKVGRNAEAVAEYQAALAIKPDFADAEINWGNVLHGERRLSDAIVHFARAAAIDPAHSGAEFNWGISLAEGGDLGQAVMHLERAAALDPSDSDARAALADVRRALRGEMRP
ncbi:MAG: repeat-containing protein, partial [Gemmatimonadetes bacterium]|nr:repeat-containing protein [Gemmatimonadota bacterium]